MVFQRLIPFILAGSLAYSAGCNTIDPVREQQVLKNIEEVTKGNFPKKTNFPEEDAEKEAFKENLEKLLSGPNWEKTISSATTADFIDANDIGTAIKKVLRNQNSVVAKEGRSAELLVRCRPKGYDIIKDDEGRELFFDLLKQGYFGANQIRHVKTLLENFPNIAKEWLNTSIKKLVTEKDYCEAGLMAYQFITTYGSLQLTKEEFYTLGDYYENGGRKGQPRPYTTGDKTLKSDIEIAEKFYCEGLSASGDEATNAKLITKIILCANSHILINKEMYENDNVVTITDLVDHVSKLPIKKDAQIANVLVQNADRATGENRLECIINAGFMPSEKAVQEYCEKILTSGWQFEDVLFFVSKCGNTINPQKYIHFATRTLSKPQLNSEDIFYTTRALELAKESNKHLEFPHSLFVQVEKILSNHSLDMTSVSRLWNTISEKNYWREAKYEERQNIVAFINEDDEIKDKTDITIPLFVDAIKITYHMHTLNLESKDKWMQKVTKYLNNLSSSKETVFKETLSQSIEAKTYLKFAGDISFEQGRISLAYVLWTKAGFEPGVSYLENKYAHLLN